MIPWEESESRNMHNDEVTNHKKCCTQTKQLLTFKTSIQIIHYEKCWNRSAVKYIFPCNWEKYLYLWGWGEQKSYYMVNDELLICEWWTQRSIVITFSLINKDGEWTLNRFQLTSYYLTFGIFKKYGLQKVFLIKRLCMTVKLMVTSDITKHST
jgi:hypothetical protein